MAEENKSLETLHTENPLAAITTPANILIYVVDLGEASEEDQDKGMAATVLDARYLLGSNNLSDLVNAATARTNIGLVSGGAGDIWVEKAGDTMAGTLAMADNLITRPVIKDYGESVNDIGDFGGGEQDIDLESGNTVAATVSTAEVTFTFSNPPASGTAGAFTLILTNGGSQTVNWPGSVDWAGGNAPTLTTSGVDVLTFFTIDGGTTWYGFAAGLDMQ